MSSCSASDGTCATADSGGLSILHSNLARLVTTIIFKDSDENMTISLLFISTIFLAVIAFHFLNKDWHIWRDIKLTLEGIFDRVPSLDGEVELPLLDSMEKPTTKKPINELLDPANPTLVQCYSPSTLVKLGTVPNLNAKQVNDMAKRSQTAQQSWKTTTFAQRRHVLRTLQKYIVAHIDEICQLCAMDSGKTQVDALLGEILTTCEKIRTLLHHGETWLDPSYRTVNPMMMHKTAYVEYVPLGVLGIIAPWNYPFHNMLNHVLSGIFSGNGVVTKCSEHTVCVTSHI